jgi:hypothetical protein
MTALYPAVSRLPAIPWRVRKKLETWVENDARVRLPALYAGSTSAARMIHSWR